MGVYNPENPEHRRLLGEAIIQRLQKAGFSEEAVARNGIQERVFYRMVDGIKNVRIKVYTGVVGYNAPECRAVGRDSIKVCVVHRDHDGQDRGVLKNTRVHRTGLPSAILDRMIQRMRESWIETHKIPKCPKCGTITFTSRNGNQVCSAICWKKSV